LLLLVRAALAQHADSLPTQARWMQHLTQELMPFWTMPQALGNPLGAFPTNRYNNGDTVRPGMPPPDSTRETAQRWGWYHGLSVVALSRQTYAYCVAYYITGEERYLGYAKAGVDWLLKYGRGQDGGFYDFVDPESHMGSPRGGSPIVAAAAYGLLGPGIYYCLTRDAGTLRAIRQSHQHTLKVFGDCGNWTHLRNTDRRSRPAITDQLDPVNAYVYTMASVAPAAERAAWQADLRKLLSWLIRRYYCPGSKSFQANADGDDTVPRCDDHAPGYEAKAAWFLYCAGERFADTGFCGIAARVAPELVARVYRPDRGCWATGGQGDWWHHAELDQFTATLAIRDSTLRPCLARTNRYWFERFVDHRYGEVYECGSDQEGCTQVPKLHAWKNGFHSLEHCLVGYITAAATRRQPVTLYYAFGAPPDSGTLYPYHLQGRLVKLEKLEPLKDKALAGLSRYRATFEDVH
jgi:hypothetical protein